MLSLANLGDNACLSAATLETLQCAIDGFAFLDMNLRHLYFPPSEVSGLIQDTLRAIIYGFNISIIQTFRAVVKRFSGKSAFLPGDQSAALRYTMGTSYPNVRFPFTSMVSATSRDS